jgi:Transposase DDE domain
MAMTPFFPAWFARLAPMGSRWKETAHTVQTYTLAQLECLFGACLPDSLFPKTSEKENSRDRIYTQHRTVWTFLWQCLNRQTSCRKAVRQLQALFILQGGPHVSEEDGAYCRARKRLTASTLREALAHTAHAADQRAAPTGLLQNRPLKVVDGSSATLSDTPANRKAFPAPKTQTKLNTGFPLMRLVVIFSLASGAIMSMLQGNLHQAELRLFQLLLDTFEKGDIVIGDRGFGNFVALILLQQIGVDFIARSARRCDGRQARKRLGKNDWLMIWQRSSQPSALLTPEQWAQVPREVLVRMVRGSLCLKGFRVRQVTLVTTLLDPVLYPAQEILRAYLRRWRLEMCLDDLKTTLGMETLRCRSPKMVEKEALTYLIGHNLVRWLMVQAAAEHKVELERISFKGAVDSLREFSNASAQARSRKQRQALWDEMLRTLAADLLPERPGRCEPRAVKRKRHKYPHLLGPRHRFRGRPKRSQRRTAARLRKLSVAK